MRRALAFAALSLVALSASASAQRGRTVTMTPANPSPEIGVDAGITFGLDSPNTTSIDIPAQRIRIGFFMSPQLSIEPSLGLTSLSGGGERFTAYSIGLGALYHFQPSRMMNQFYARPFIDFNGVSVSGAGSESGFTFGGGVGVKVPMRDRIAGRLEANFARTSMDAGSSNAIGLLAGLSFYTR